MPRSRGASLPPIIGLLLIALAAPDAGATIPDPPAEEPRHEVAPTAPDDDATGGIVGGIVGPVATTPLTPTADNPNGPRLLVPGMSMVTTHKVMPRRPSNPAWPEGPRVQRVVLEDVDRDGVPIIATATDCPTDFVKSSVAAAKAWRFAPWLDGEGRPIIVRSEVTITFEHP